MEDYGLEWVGPEESENISAMAREVMFEFYTFVEAEALQRFFNEFQTPDAIRRQFDEGYHYAFVVINGIRIGYIAYYIEGETMDLSKIYLLKQYRMHGIGNSLLDRIIKAAKDKGCKGVKLDVNGKNEHAISLYLKKGFVKTGSREYPSGTLDIMRLEL